MADDPWADFIPSSAPAKASDPWADFIPKEPSTGMDVVKSAGTGLAKGAMGLVGLPQFVTSTAAVIADAAAQAPGRLYNHYLGDGSWDLPESARRGAEAAANGGPRSLSDLVAGTNRKPLRLDPADILPSGTDIQNRVEQFTGKLHEPQTGPGRMAETLGEFVPGGAVGRVANIPANIAKWGVAPGIAAAGAGEAARGSGYEAPAKIGAALLAGGGAALAFRPSQAGLAITRAAEGMTPAHLGAMEALMRDAQAMGLPLSRAEAAQAVTNGATSLADLQRVVEGSGQMKGFYAQRPQQVEAVGRQAMDTIAPVPQAPSMVGPAVGDAARGVVDDVTGAINRTTRPLYDAAEQARVGQPVAQALAGDPLYAQTLQAIRRDPSLNRTIANLPDDSPGVIDLVQRRLRENAENAAIPGQASSSNLAAANFQDARTAPIAAAETATGSRPGVMGDYEAARALQTQLREQYLAPLTNGPIGKLAQKDLPTQKAIEALFPKNPIPNSEGEVQTAVQALSARNPWAARQLVRAHAESTFNNATRGLQSGDNQFGGASFAAQLRGNFQQDANLLAAVSALPHGQQIINGFDRMLQVMEATGQRQRIGSQTAFNQEAQAALKAGSPIAQGGALVAGVGMKLPGQILQKVQQWNLGKNTEEIARLLTDPNAASAFRALAEAPIGSAKAGAALTRLTALADRGREKQQ